MTKSAAGAPPASNSGRVEIIDCYRLGAAVVVLCFHYFFNGLHNGRLVGVAPTKFENVAQYGYLGVELFFLISGFVIMSSAHGRSAGHFAASRAVRLYPAFIAGLLLTTVFILVAGHRSGISVTPGQLVANLTMVPQLLGAEPVDGVYWTLRYEIEFYALVGLMLFFAPRLLERAMPVWALLMVPVAFLAPISVQSKPFMGGYFALFAVGAILAEIKAAGLNRLRAAGLAAGVVVAVNWGVTAADMQADETGVPFSHSVVIVLHLIAIALVALPLVPAISRLSIPGSRMAGALTYPLYLVHAFIGYIVMSQIARVAPDWVAYVVTIAFVVLLAWLLHKFVEEGCASLWKRHADRYVRQPIEAIELRWQHRRDRSQRVIAPAWNEGEAGGA